MLLATIKESRWLPIEAFQTAPARGPQAKCPNHSIDWWSN